MDKNINRLNEDELLIKIGKDLAESEMLITYPSKEQLLNKGRNWFENNYKRLEERICLSDKAKFFSNSSDIDTATILSAISDLISSVCIGVSPFTVSRLILKRGLKMLCHKYW